MFRNLLEAMDKEGFTAKFVSEFLDISQKSWENKSRGRSEFTFSEYKKLLQLFGKYNADWLFKEFDDAPKAS